MISGEDVGISQQDLERVEEELKKVPPEFQELMGIVEGAEEEHPARQRYCYGD